MKVRLQIKPLYERYASIFNYKNLFLRNNIEFVESGEDLVLFGDIQSIQNCPDKPFIVLEKYACGMVRWETNLTRRHPNYICTFKNVTLPNGNYHCVFNRPHFHIINELFNLGYNFKIKTINPDVRQVIWNLHYSPYRQTLIAKPSKKLHLLSASFNDSEGDIIKRHRQLARQKAQQSGGDTEIYDLQDYLERLGASHIALSPWGWGEYCMRDYEAVLSEAVVIKPMPYPLLDQTGIYANKKVIVPCQPDFSDLHDRIEYVMDNYSEFQEAVVLAKHNLLKTTIVDLVDKMCNEIKRALWMRLKLLKLL